MNERQLISALRSAGVILPPEVKYISKTVSQMRAMDAASLSPTLVSTPSAGVPSFLTTFLDPEIIRVLTAPMNASRLVGEKKEGDWTTLVAAFIQAESTGRVATYGDFSSDGHSEANVNYPQRQSYPFQTWTEWGLRQLDMAGAGRVDWAAEVNMASALVIAKFLNASYLYGIKGLQNYGLTNDPGLPAAETATINWSTASPEEVYNDFNSLFGQLLSQSQGLITQTQELRVGIPPTAWKDLNNANSYGLSAYDLIRKNFTETEFVSIPEFDTPMGRLVQMWAPTVDGKRTAVCAFTEKLRAHSVETYSTYYRQKKSAGTWGAVIWRPFAVAQKIGV